MTDQRKPIRAHLTLIELLIIVALLGGAGIFLVRSMAAAKHRAQFQEFTEALNEWELLSLGLVPDTTPAKPIFAMVKANPELKDARSRNGTTPLHVAAWQDNREIAQWLLDHGADVNAKTNDGRTPLHHAASNGYPETVELLLAKGANIDAQDNDGGTPLFRAVLHGRLSVVELLLAKDADQTLRPRDGKTPFLTADFVSPSDRLRILELFSRYPPQAKGK